MSVVFTIAAIALRRLVKGRAIWISGVMAVLPILFVLVLKSKNASLRLANDLFAVEQLLLLVVPPMLIATAISDELDDRTTAYLWSRPVPRWTVLVGKLVALAPIAIAFVLASWIAGSVLAHSLPPIATVLALAAGGLATGIVSTGMATLVPKHGIALTITYFLFLDLPIGVMPASLRFLSITHHVRSIGSVTFGPLAEPDPASTGVIGLLVICAIWLAVALLKIRRLEA